MSRFKPTSRNSNFGSNNTDSAPNLRLSHKLSKARQDGTLSLAGMNLTSIPDAAFNLRSSLLNDNSNNDNSNNGQLRSWECFGEEMLNTLDLSDNPLHYLPPQILQKFEALKKLRAKRCGLEGIFDFNFSQSMKELETLDLSNNEIDGVFDLAMLPGSMVDINLTNNRINNLQANVENDVHLTSLKIVDISSNRLHQIPASLLLNSPLVNLNMSTNALTSLPCKLPSSLKVLDINSNDLYDPPDLSLLVNLTECDLSNNRLTTPPSIYSSLLIINLSNNAIQTLELLFNSPDSSRSTKLIELKIRGNKLSLLPSAIFHYMTDLTLLDIGSNDLSDLPSILGYLPALTKIKLDGNMLRGSIKSSTDTNVLKKSLRFRCPPPIPNAKFICQDGGDFEQIEGEKTEQTSQARGAIGGSNTLDLSDKQLTALPDRVLDELNVDVQQDDYADLSYRSESVTLGSRVRTFKARNNAITVINGNWFDILTGLREVDLGRNKIEYIPENMGALSLGTLTLDGNLFDTRSISKTLFPRNSINSPLCTSLLILNISSNRISSIPSMLFELTSLHTLNLSYNNITTLEGRGGWIVAGGLKHLTSLDLSNNKISNLGILPIDLKYKSNITTLNLSNNELRSIDYELGFVETLKSLDLRGNPQKGVRVGVLERGADELLEYLRSKVDPAAVEKREPVRPQNNDSNQNQSRRGFDQQDEIVATRGRDERKRGEHSRDERIEPSSRSGGYERDEHAQNQSRSDSQRRQEQHQQQQQQQQCMLDPYSQQSRGDGQRQRQQQQQQQQQQDPYSQQPSGSTDRGRDGSMRDSYYQQSQDSIRRQQDQQQQQRDPYSQQSRGDGQERQQQQQQQQEYMQDPYSKSFRGDDQRQRQQEQQLQRDPYSQPSVGDGKYGGGRQHQRQDEYTQSSNFDRGGRDISRRDERGYDSQSSRNGTGYTQISREGNREQLQHPRDSFDQPNRSQSQRQQYNQQQDRYSNNNSPPSRQQERYSNNPPHHNSKSKSSSNVDSEIDEARMAMDNLQLSLNHVHNTEVMKYGIKKQMELQRGVISKLEMDKKNGY